MNCCCIIRVSGWVGRGRGLGSCSSLVHGLGGWVGGWVFYLGVACADDEADAVGTDHLLELGVGDWREWVGGWVGGLIGGVGG